MVKGNSERPNMPGAKRFEIRIGRKTIWGAPHPRASIGIAATWGICGRPGWLLLLSFLLDLRKKEMDTSAISPPPSTTAPPPPTPTPTPPPLTTAEKIEKGKALKDLGNQEFKAGNHVEAIKNYHYVSRCRYNQYVRLNGNSNHHILKRHSRTWPGWTTAVSKEWLKLRKWNRLSKMISSR